MSTTTRCVDLSKAASDLMDQVERNRATVDDPSDLMKLIWHVEVKNHGAVRLQWNFKHLVVVIVAIVSLAQYYGVFAFGAGTPILGLRGSNSASPNLRGTQRNTNDRPAHLVEVPRSRGGGVRAAHSLKMLEPMTVSALVLGCFDKMQSSKATTRQAKMAARRAARDAETVISTLAQEGAVAGTYTLARATARSLATQTLLSTDEDERPVQRTVLDDVSESVIDALDKASSHAVAHANFIHKTSNIAIKAAHGLDVMAAHHPMAAGLASVAVISGIAISMSLARPSGEGDQGKVE